MTAALVSATLVAVATRPWGTAGLAWVALVPAFHAVARPPGRSALRAGVITYVAAVGFAAVAYEATLGLALVAYPLVVGVAALPFGAAGAAAAWVSGRSRALPAWAALPIFWCATEVLVRQEWLLGRWALPLSAIGYTQSGTAAVHLARFSSVTAVSLAVLLVNGLIAALVAALWDRPAGASTHASAPPPSLAAPRLGASARLAPARARPALVGLAIVGALIAAAWRTAPAPPAAQPGPLHDPSDQATGPTDPAVALLAVLQPDLPPAARGAARLDAAVAAEVAAGLVALSTAGATPGGGLERQLQVWPEAIWPAWLPRGAAQAAAAQPAGAPAQPAAVAAQRAAVAAQLAAVAGQLAGAPPAILGGAGRDAATGSASNAAFLWSGTTLTHVFDKRHTVPIAEDGLVRSGAPVVVLGGGIRVAPLICYDVAFPATVRLASRGGAELLAVLTDDTFAAGSDVPRQHLRVARLRAVESGLWLAFASNGGPSALIDPAGRIAAATEPGEAALLRATARLGTGSTPYLAYGDWVGVLAWLLVAVAASLAGLEGGGYRRPRAT